MDGKNEGVIVRHLLKKITVADCKASPDIEKIIAHKNEHGEKSVMPLLTVFGIASDFKAGENKATGSTFVRFLGQFKAVNVATGETFISGQCILPGAAPDLLYGALQGLGENGGSIDFAFNIGARFDATAITKYVYSVDQIVEVKQDDPLARLENMLKGQAALPAPEPEAEPEAEKPGKKK